jgi:hypothetical protein
MNTNVFAETSRTVFLDNGDGSLTVKRKSNLVTGSTVAYFKNDEQGRKAYQKFRSSYPNRKGLYILYRVTNNGKSYDETNNPERRFKNISRRGSIRKSNAKVFAVLDKSFQLTNIL